MNNKELDILLSKFYRGETSLDEERLLRESLAGDDADALLMQALDKMEDDVEVPSDFEQSLSDMIDQWDDKEQHKAKVTPSLWQRTSWIAAAASVAVVATVGWWMMRNNSTPSITEKNLPVIAKIQEKPEQTDVKPIIETVENNKEQQAQHPQRISKPAKTLKHEVGHLAQASAKPSAKSVPKSTLTSTKSRVKPIAKATAKPSVESVDRNLEAELSPEEELLAIEALEKFSTVLNKGVNQLNDAGEKIDNITNTIEHLL